VDNRRKMPMRTNTRMENCPDGRMITRAESRMETLPAPGPDHPCAEQPACMVLAMAYVPMQKFEELYNPEVGFDRGTVFCALDLPYLGTPVCDGEEDCCHD